MKYSITVLQAEITRLENAIKYDLKSIEHCEKVIKSGNSGDLEKKHAKKHIEESKKVVKNYKAQITELKADIKKL